jgi:hypothetical protein
MSDVLSFVAAMAMASSDTALQRCKLELLQLAS